MNEKEFVDSYQTGAYLGNSPDGPWILHKTLYILRKFSLDENLYEHLLKKSSIFTKTYITLRVK